MSDQDAMYWVTKRQLLSVQLSGIRYGRMERVESVDGPQKGNDPSLYCEMMQASQSAMNRPVPAWLPPDLKDLKLEFHDNAVDASMRIESDSMGNFCLIAEESQPWIYITEERANQFIDAFIAVRETLRLRRVHAQIMKGGT